MAAVTVRNPPEETQRALKLSAAKDGHDREAKIPAILEEALHPIKNIKVGSELAAFGRRFGGLDLKVSRDPTPLKAATFE
jgi:plasmid stability protein